MTPCLHRVASEECALGGPTGKRIAPFRKQSCLSAYQNGNGSTDLWILMPGRGRAAGHATLQSTSSAGGAETRRNFSSVTSETATPSSRRPWFQICAVTAAMLFAQVHTVSSPKSGPSTALRRSLEALEAGTEETVHSRQAGSQFGVPPKLLWSRGRDLDEHPEPAHHRDDRGRGGEAWLSP